MTWDFCFSADAIKSEGLAMGSYLSSTFPSIQTTLDWLCSLRKGKWESKCIYVCRS